MPTAAQLAQARAAGASVVRVATHCTEADIAQEHLAWAAEHGMRAVGFLMMSHMLEPRELLEQARLMECYGARVVYVVDSAGAMVPRDVAARVAALAGGLGCAVGNALAAADAGATWLDGSVRGLGAGAGNARTEALCAALDRAGHRTGVDRLALSLGYAGVYSSFLLHAERAAAKYGVDAREILLELGRRRMVGGQEDMIIDVAAAMAATHGGASRR